MTTNIQNHRQELLDYKREATRELLIKTLLSLVGIIAGVAISIFLNIAFLPWGVGLTVLSALAFYHYFHQYRHTSSVLGRAAEAVTIKITI